MSRSTRLTLLLVGVCVLTGCGGEPGTEAGFGLPTLTVDDATTVGEIDATLVVEPNGCFTADAEGPADGMWIVWPASARQDGDEVVLESGSRLQGGDALRGHGALRTLADLPAGGDPDSYFGSFGGFCGADERGVLVLTDVTTP